MPDREELHELHVDQSCTGAQCQGITIAAHIERGAVAPEQSRQTAGRDDGCLGRDRHRAAAANFEGNSAGHGAIGFDQVNDQQVTDASNGVVVLVQHFAQRLRNRGPVLRKST